MSGLHACIKHLLDGVGGGRVVEPYRQVTPLACPQLLADQSKLKAVTAHFKLRVIRQILFVLVKCE